MEASSFRGGQLGTPQQLVATTLSLNVSRQEVFIEEILPIYGLLRDQGGSALGGRNVTISWGMNQTTVATDTDGKFGANVSFPIGFPAGSTMVEARFEPTGPDLASYLSSRSSLEVRVEYQPSSIEADIYPRSARRLDSVKVLGHLSSPGGLPLESKTVVFRLDGTSLGNTTTNSTGGFLFWFTVPANASDTAHSVTASFIPLGDRLAPSNTTLQLVVGVSMYTVQGYVMSPDGTTPVLGCWVSIYEPASNATIGSRTDNKGYYSLLAGEGIFVFDLSPPSTSPSYANYREVNFAVSSDIWKNMTLRYGTQVAMKMDRTSLFSGEELAVEGTVRLVNDTLWKQGHASVFVDSFYYDSTTVREDGSFLSQIQLPMNVGFGSHTIKVEYFPDEPWLAPSEATTQVYVYNTEVIVFAAFAVLTASSAMVYRIARNRHAAGLVPSVLPVAVAPPSVLPEPAVAEPLSKDEYSAERLAYLIKAEHGDTAKVSRSYRLARAMLDQKLDREPVESETHWEYFSRIAKEVPNVEDLFRRLSELFELAEYSQTPIQRAQSEEAARLLLKLREEIWGEDRQEYGNEYQA